MVYYYYFIINLFTCIIVALAAEDLPSIIEGEITSEVPLLPFLLSCLYMYIVQVKGEAAVEIEQVLRTVLYLFMFIYLVIFYCLL